MTGRGPSSHDPYLDYLRGFAIVWVVLIHSTSTMNMGFPDALTFEMPLFFFVSGASLYLARSRSGPVRQFLWRRLRRLLVPYAQLAVICVVLFYAGEMVAGRPLSASYLAGWLLLAHHSPYPPGVEGYMWFMRVAVAVTLAHVVLIRVFASLGKAVIGSPLINGHPPNVGLWLLGISWIAIWLFLRPLMMTVADRVGAVGWTLRFLGTHTYGVYLFNGLGLLVAFWVLRVIESMGLGQPSTILEIVIFFLLALLFSALVAVVLDGTPGLMNTAFRRAVSLRSSQSVAEGQPQLRTSQSQVWQSPLAKQDCPLYNAPQSAQPY